MKRIGLLLTLMLFLSFGMVQSQTLVCDLDNVDGLFSPTQIGLPSSLQFNFRITNIGIGYKVKGAMNGFAIYGALADGPMGDVAGSGNENNNIDATVTWAITDYGPDLGIFGLMWFEQAWAINPFSVSGSNADTLGFGGACAVMQGFPDGYDDVLYYINVDVPVGTNDGKILCMDSAFFPPSGVWKWGYGTEHPAPEYPTWTGPFCWDLYFVPDLPPVWVTDPAADANAGHTAAATWSYEANDPDVAQANLVFSEVSCTGAGSNGITAQTTGNPGNGTCDYSYAPVFPTDVVTDVTVVIDVTDGVNTVLSAGCVVSFGNAAPTFNDGCGDYVEFSKGATESIQFGGTDTEDATHIVLDDVTPVTPTPPGGNVSINGSGLVTFASASNDCIGDANTAYTVKVWISDGLDSVSCTATFMVLFTEAYEVEIGGTPRGIIGPVVQGTHVNVPVTLNLGSEYLRGFDILIGYDASALIFTAATKGALYAPPFGICDPAWEYFDYRYNWNGNCGNACPSGVLRVVGIGETNDGPVSPDFACLDGIAKPYALFNLDFLVTNDRTFECQFVPISFYWMDCGDNSLAYDPVAPPDNEAIQGVSRYVFTWNGTKIGDALPVSPDYGLGMATGFPTYTGIQYDPCMIPDPLYPLKPLPVPWVDFINGGIEIYCADEIDDRGDINMNGVSNEIADAVLFSNYFIHGLSVFTIGTLAPAGQVAATDVNADGLTLSVADLVYLIRIIVGDALPYPKLGTVAASYTLHNGVMSVDSKMGAAHVVVEGNVAPILLADNMDMMYNFDGANTRILVSKIEQGAAFEGDFLQVDGNVITAEFATYEGAPVASVAVPQTAQLYQNYPNPFNPMTTISFGLPTAGEYTLTIYNVTGQTVTTFSDNAEAGNITVDWDASNMASGIYFYKLDANDFTDTKKMVLLK